jgi:glycosyltransferase involved in cell wall biosynthesis
MATPTHSVIVPVLNGARYINECLDSILVQLGPDDELIVVDNGSTDGTLSLIEGYDDPRIVLLHQPRRGTAGARNTGLLRAHGRYICFQDHDDLWPPGRQQALLHAILTTPGANAAHGRMRVIFDGVEIDPPYAAMDGQYVLLHSAMTAMFERSLLERAGLLDETMLLGADVDYLVRLRQIGMVAATCDADVHIRRRHGSNSSSVGPTTIRTRTMQILHRNIVRNRNRR